MKNLTSTAGFCAVITFLCIQPVIAQPSLTLHHQVFTTTEGKITVFLPPLHAGSAIAGTIWLEPAGNSKQTEKNRKALQARHLYLGTIPIDLSNAVFSLRLPATKNGGEAELRLTEGTGNLIRSAPLPLLPAPEQDAVSFLPAYLVKGDPAVITGPFDGDLSNTRVTVNGQPANLLAEFPGGVYFKTTALPGKASLTCTEDNLTRTADCQVLQLDLAVGKSNLLKGEQTQLTIRISGLEGLKEKVPVMVQNTSLAVINLQGGDQQQFRISPATGSDVYETTRQIQSLRNGDFSVSVSIPPSVPAASLLCNCYINGRSFLLPPSVCAHLDGRTSANASPASPQTANPAGIPPPAVLEKPGDMDPRTGLMPLRLRAPAAGVLFSVQSAGSNEWQAIDSVAANGDNWQALWTVPLGSDGLYTIRARMAGMNNEVTTVTTQAHVELTPAAYKPTRNERMLFTVSEEQVRQAENNAWQTFGEIDRLQQQLNELRERSRRLQEEEEIKRQEAEELAAIDKTLEKIPGEYAEKLKALADSLKKLQGALPAGSGIEELNQAADDAAQRVKDCEDRLNKLKEEQKKLQQQRDDLKKQQDDLLNEMDKLHHDAGWIGRHGFHKSGKYWFGYVGDSEAGSGMTGRSYEIDRQLRGLNKQYRDAITRLEALDKEIAAARAECDKLRKAAEDAGKAADTGNKSAATAVAMDELCRQIQSLLGALKAWCGAHAGACGFMPALNALSEKCPKAPAEVDEYLGGLDDLIKQKQQKEKDLVQEADNKAAEAASAAQQAAAAEAAKKAQEAELKRQQEEANRLRKEREKQLEEEREKRRKLEEKDNAERATPKPQPPLTEPVEPDDDQLKFQAQVLFRSLYLQYLVDRGPCDCITKAIALANNTNTIVTDLIGRIGVGVAFAPLEAFPGFSLTARLGIGAAKALAGALYGGQNFSEELAKNLFNVIGGEIFPHLLGDDFTGNRLNELASGGLDKLLENEGVRTISWEGETELRNCGKVKGKTVMMVNPNTGWVCILIKIDNCPLVVIKYKVNSDGVPVTKPIVQTVKG